MGGVKQPSDLEGGVNQTTGSRGRGEPNHGIYIEGGVNQTTDLEGGVNQTTGSRGRSEPNHKIERDA